MWKNEEKEALQLHLTQASFENHMQKYEPDP